MFLKAELCSGNQLIGLFFSAFLSNSLLFMLNLVYIL